MANNGLGFEEYLSTLHSLYQKQGKARLCKTTPPVKVLVKPLPGGVLNALNRFLIRCKKYKFAKFFAGGAKGKGHLFAGFFEAMGEPDFKGVLKGGQMVSFDAKHSTQERFQFKALLKTHQTESMTLDVRLGALCFYLVRHGRSDYLLPVNSIGEHPAALFGKASCKWADLEAWRIPSGQTWLDVVHEFCERWRAA
jgi:penicillin-binding protein-related factor A (putative recombinase)